jgi:hypothetical protein
LKVLMASALEESRVFACDGGVLGVIDERFLFYFSHELLGHREHFLNSIRSYKPISDVEFF